jgi:GNAT superfamily N-acetyltransferase
MCQATVDDLAALERALAWAIEWRSPVLSASPADIIRDSGLNYLLEGWGRPGDAAVVGWVEAHTVGAAWYRHWNDAWHSYGYLDATTPELGIGVDSEWRGLGIGAALLEALIGVASRSDVTRLSLSVEGDNPAMALYEGFGFVRIEPVDGSWTMARAVALGPRPTKASSGRRKVDC